MRRATCLEIDGFCIDRCVSIHAPHAEGDGALAAVSIGFKVSIHAPHAEGDGVTAEGFRMFREFQSTPPMRRATADAQGRWLVYRVSIHAPHAEGDLSEMSFEGPTLSFNPRPPCGGRLHDYAAFIEHKVFQSTPPMRRATWRPAFCSSACNTFQSTPPMRRATTVPRLSSRGSTCFNPRPPCGGRLISRLRSQVRFWFQSTPPMRRATAAGPTVGLTTA